MNACLRCGQPGVRDVTHACVTAGIYNYPPAFAPTFVVCPPAWIYPPFVPLSTLIPPRLW